MENQDSLIEQIENDDFFKEFLSDDSSRALLTKSIAFTEQVRKLGEGIDALNKELQRQVLENHQDLLRQAHHATKLEDVLNIMNGHVQNLMANAERLRTQITVPCEQLENHTKVLSRLHKASHILRQVARVQQLSKKLGSTNDPVQKALLLQELEQLAADPELTDIDAITTELRNVRVQRQKVVQLAIGALHQGIEHENVVQTSMALQIFINLGTIEPTLETLIKENLNECGDILKMALDSATNPVVLVKSGRGQLPSSQGFRQKVWTELEKGFSEGIYKICKQIKFLQSALDELHMPHKVLAEQFWDQLGQIVKGETGRAAASAAVQQLLHEDYPKLLKFYCDMMGKLSYEQFKFDRDVLKPLENSYLSSSLTKILEPVQSMFNMDGTVPSQDQIDALIRVLTSELSVALVEEQLSVRVAKNVSKCIKMFAVKTEQQIENGPEAAQVIGGSANGGQQKNLQYANSLHYFSSQTQRMLNNMRDSLSEEGLSVINESLRTLDALTGAILQPLVTSINSVIETIMVTMHLEPDWGRPSSTLCSPYMRELVQFIHRVYRTYLSGFTNRDVLSEKCSEIALRCIELFVRHSSILRPLSRSGRQRLQSDCRHLEEALKLICPQLPSLGRPYRLLKSVATLITQSAEEIVAGQARGGGGSVPHSTILFMLFSYAGAELASPHQNTGWSLPKLSAWLDEHPNESDRLDLIAGAIQRYESLIRAKNSPNYDPVYPIMSKFLENALKETAL
ncbi:conserved oligomeric Golgi complex subunit 5 [Anthonomus grandis grandis]|uniref:conserved oligomeric Golgi complex subunit 5 n=1 Tax=Anthonomus grandis grandis TaxID=2921223 RepID=UPI00216514A3|nr:conserved oligomeric Golgi complex subunit 5 [Anthonomus grandis grandis]